MWRRLLQWWKDRRRPEPPFTLADFVRRMEEVIRLTRTRRWWLPRQPNSDEDSFFRLTTRMTSIYASMTVAERQAPEMLGLSRRRRIARGSGVELNEVGAFIKQSETTRDMMRDVVVGGFAAKRVRRKHKKRRHGA